MTELERIIYAGETTRAKRLALLESYYHGCQYDGLPHSWDETVGSAGAVVPFRKRRPSTVLPVPKLVVDSHVKALWGKSRRPTVDAAFVKLVDESGLIRAMRDATRRALTIGSGLVVWRKLDGAIRAEAWDAKSATPTFKPGTTKLAKLDYRFCFVREVDGENVEFVHRELLDEQRWTVFADVENPKGDREPEWGASETVDHALGFVPAVWIAVGERADNGFDGTSIFGSCIGLIDELNYTASQLARAIYQNCDPQTVLIGVPGADIEQFFKSGFNTWPLPEKGDAKLLESNGKFAEFANARINDLRKAVLDACSVVMNDPERVSGGQSGSALELLLEPMLSKVDELRDDFGAAYAELLSQMSGSGKPIAITWGSHLPATPTDAAMAAGAVDKAVTRGVLSRKAGARYLASYFGVTDVEADAAEIEKDQQSEDKRLSRIEDSRNGRIDESSLPTEATPAE